MRALVLLALAHAVRVEDTIKGGLAAVFDKPTPQGPSSSDQVLALVEKAEGKLVEAKTEVNQMLVENTKDLTSKDSVATPTGSVTGAKATEEKQVAKKEAVPTPAAKKEKVPTPAANWKNTESAEDIEHRQQMADLDRLKKNAESLREKSEEYHKASAALDRIKNHYATDPTKPLADQDKLEESIKAQLDHVKDDNSIKRPLTQLEIDIAAHERNRPVPNRREELKASERKLYQKFKMETGKA